jgi:DNA-binding LacI/PurR family transcriptional regulator
MKNLIAGEVQLNSEKHLSLQVAEILERRIKDREIKVGQKLPPQEELAKMFKVSLGTVKDALSNLVSAGYISRRRKYGTFVISAEPRTSDALKRKNGVYMVVCAGDEFSSPNLANDVMFQSILKGVQVKSREKGAFLGYTVVYNDKEELFLGGKERELAGLIVAGGKTGRHMKKIRKLNIPYVLIGDLLDKPGEEADADVIANNDFDGAYMATKHLTGLGHKRIVYLHEPPKYQWEKDKLEGYRKALKDAGIAFDKKLLIEIKTYNSETAYKLMKAFLGKSIRFTALIGRGVNFSYGLIQAIVEKGLKIPEDVSLIELGPSTEYTNVFYDLEELGRTAFDRLYYRLTTPGWKPERIIVPHKLTIRNSTRKV